MKTKLKFPFKVLLCIILCGVVFSLLDMKDLWENSLLVVWIMAYSIAAVLFGSELYLGFKYNEWEELCLYGYGRIIDSVVFIANFSTLLSIYSKVELWLAIYASVVCGIYYLHYVVAWYKLRDKEK